MHLIEKKYHQLKPQIEYLADEVIMAQAWKKTHSYMRTHNWYADTLALDVSALSLEGSLKNWVKDIKDTKRKLELMELIPAAKNDPWLIDAEKGWVPKRDPQVKEGSGNVESKVPLRPLAHLTVRDQTWATSAMLCLADIVEGKQGDCSGGDLFRHKRDKVYSYGNRLHCDWNEEGKAWFRWGNSQVYRKFFTDYQNFLNRPVEIGREVAQNIGSSELVFIVSLDISKFYDNIDRSKLIHKLKKISDESGTGPCEKFWKSFTKIVSWKWRNEDKERARNLDIKISDDRGLPQGLVSAGFYANAYLIDFDADVGNSIGKEIPELDGINLHDYCRYVDDLRLVISLDKIGFREGAATKLASWLNKILQKHTNKLLSFNHEKTQLTCLSDLDNKGSLSRRVAQLQDELSGPADRDVLDNAMGSLEGLLSTSEEEIPDLPSGSSDLGLVRIAKFDHDIRMDTLKRFAANRLEVIMKNKRKIDLSFNTEASDEIDNQSELLAKKLVWAWMQNPSLALVLRKALEIFPSPDMAEPIFEAILVRSTFSKSNKKDEITKAMMNYLIADLFRTCIDLHGYFQRVDYPRSSNPEQLIELGCRYAQKVLAFGGVPPFLERQALLLLAVKEKSAPSSSASNRIHGYLHGVLAGKQLTWNRQQLALFEIASQITGMPDSVANQLIEAAEALRPEDQKVLLYELAKRAGPFWLSLWERLPKSKIGPEVLGALEWAAPVYPGRVKMSNLPLSRVIASKENPFVHESALIKLALVLVKTIQDGAENLISLSPNQLCIQKKGNQGWSSIGRPSGNLLNVNKRKDVDVIDDPRFVIPDWISDEQVTKAIYWIGCILRAAVVGVTDFTGNRWKSGDVQSYKGLRTGWYKRRMGMMHSPEALVGEFATISSWAAELLMKCLQWPGFEATYLTYEDIASFDSLDGLRKVLKDRLKKLDELYCETIGAPALITRVMRPSKRHEKGFRLVTVQQILPRAQDFTKTDPMLDDPKAKSINRDHFARICQLTYRTLQTTLAAEKKHTYPGADLIVFPELAVHIDDQDLIKRLADKTQSIIFAGLNFQEHDGKLINIGRWFIPDYRDTGRQWVIRDQGKQYPIQNELSFGVTGYRPCQHILEVIGDAEGPFFIGGAICYDATDLKLASDLKGKTDLFVVAAHNQDVSTFDTMVAALNYHMYQHVVVVNKGEYGGSTIQAPYRERFERMISHAHGTDQISINVADLDLAAFKRTSRKYKSVRTPPAG